MQFKIYDKTLKQITDVHTVKPEEDYVVLSSTGYTDKTGRPIHSGDVLKYNKDGCTICFVVRYTLPVSDTECEVVGNIHAGERINLDLKKPNPIKTKPKKQPSKSMDLSKPRNKYNLLFKKTDS